MPRLVLMTLALAAILAAGAARSQMPVGTFVQGSFSAPPPVTLDTLWTQAGAYKRLDARTIWTLDGSLYTQ